MKIKQLKTCTHINIIGFGIEGQSTLHFLQKFCPDTKITIRDQTPLTQLSVMQKTLITKFKIKYLGGTDYLAMLKSHEIMIKSAGVCIHLPQLQKFIAQGGILTTQTAIFLDNIKGKTIGITSTKGKSTTTSLIYHILHNSTKYNTKTYCYGNIGIAMLDYFLSHDDLGADKIFVLELSSYQLHGLKQSPNIAIYFNLFTCHLSWHQTLSDYYNAKTNITRYQGSNDHFFYHTQHYSITQAATDSPAKTHNLAHSSIINKNDILFDYKTKIIARQNIKLIGAHNTQNIITAITIARHLGICHTEIAHALTTYIPLPHRLEPLTINHKHFINDSISVVPESTIAGIKALSGQIDCLIIGGNLTKLDFSQLVKIIIAQQIPHIITLPSTGNLISQQLLILNPQMHIINFPLPFTRKMMKKVCQTAYELTRDGRYCLFSPAANSHEFWPDFTARGADFKKYLSQIVVD